MSLVSDLHPSTHLCGFLCLEWLVPTCQTYIHPLLWSLPRDAPQPRKTTPLVPPVYWTWCVAALTILQLPAFLSLSPTRLSSLRTGTLMQAYLILLHFANTEIFTIWKFMATMYQESLSVPFFHNSICSLCVCLLIILMVFQTFSLCLLWWSVAPQTMPL